MEKRSDQSSRLSRNIIEKNRRNLMKSLFFELASIIPPQQSFITSKDVVSRQDQLDLAASYIKQLKERIDKLKGMKEQLAMNTSNIKPNSNNNIMDETSIGSNLPVVELRDLVSSIEVVLITGLHRNFMFCEVISILEEEGAEVVSASFYTIGGKVFHTVHAQVKILRVGVDTSSIRQRLYELVY